MIVPMVLRSEAIGAITFVSEEPGRYGEDDLEMAQRLAQKASLAIENARLFRRERQARAAIERAADRMARLQALTSDLATALTSEAVAQVVIDHSSRAVGATTAGIWALDTDHRYARLLRAWSYTPEEIERFAVIDLQGPAPVAVAMRRRTPIFLESVNADRDRDPETADRASQELARVETSSSYACLPLFVGDEAIGALAFALRGDHVLDGDERAFLTVAAGHCAQSLYARASTRPSAARAPRWRSCTSWSMRSAGPARSSRCTSWR